MKKRALSLIAVALVLATLLIGIQTNVANAWDHDLLRPAPAGNP
jgi:hypothetical protein